MMIRISFRHAVVACASFALLSAVFISPAAAGTISAVPASTTVSGPGLGFAAVPAITTPNPNNDNQLGGEPLTDNNIVVPLKRFDKADYIDIEFTVVPSNGVTEYKVFEFVDNNTGSSWASYNMQLGFGTGAGFVASTAGDAVDFDHPTFDTPPSSGAFTMVTLGEDLLVYHTGSHAAGAQPYQMRIDVGDFLGRLPRFTLRQTPIIPEPASFVLAGLATAAIAMLRRR